MLDLIHNPKFYSGEVKINVMIKNIKKLKVRVFEVNTENYLKSNLNENYENIKIECLIPQEEYWFNYD